MPFNIRNLAKIIIPLILFGFLVFNTAYNWQTVVKYLIHFNPTPLIISFFLILFIYPEGAFCWYLVLRKMGLKVGLLKVIRIWIIANTSRYIPGKIWQYIGRVELAKREANIERPKAIFSLLMEVFLGLTAAGLVALLALPFVRLQNLDKGLVIFLLPVLLILLHPKVANYILFLIAKFSKNRINISYSLKFSQSISIFPAYVLNFLINGLALYFLAVSLYGSDLSFTVYHILAFSGFYAFAWAVGFLSFFSPGGLGVTELTLSFLLSFLMPLSLASSLTILYRFLLTVAELLVFAFFLKLGSKDYG